MRYCGRCGEPLTVEVVPDPVALELVHRYGAIVVNLASAVMDVADELDEGHRATLRHAVAESRTQLAALIDLLQRAAADA